MKLYILSLFRAVIISTLLLYTTSFLTACQLPDIVARLLLKHEETEVAGEVLYVPQGFNITGAPFSAVNLPDVCDGDPSCGNIQFTVNRRYVAYLHGTEDCCRSLTVCDITAREPLNTWKGVQWFYIMKDGGLVINMGGCEPRYVYNYPPNTGRQRSLGLDGTTIWNSARSEVLWVVQGSPLKKRPVGLKLYNP